MRIFILTRKNLMLIFTIIFMICFSFFIFQKIKVSAIFIETNSFQDKVKNLVTEKEKVVYLTFDDGPSVNVTPKILDILKEEEVKATFFVIGSKVDEHPEIVKRAYSEGHFIANHTYSHNNNTIYKSEENFINEIKKTEVAIGNAIDKEGYCSYLFRFPTGFMSHTKKASKRKVLNTLLKMKYAYIDWNCLNNDSMKKCTNTELLSNLKKTSKNKNTLVVLMHDTKDVSDSSGVLKDSIKYLKSEGYTFKNIYNLMENYGVFKVIGK